MIATEYCRLMARDYRWQNTSLITASDGLTDAQHRMDRRAFFKSIAATLNPLYWADALMLERVKGNERPQDTLAHSLNSPSDWTEYKTLRAQRDIEIEQWAAGLADAELYDSVRWYPPDGSALTEMPKAICVVQVFTHQSHQRGQIHAMLTAMGAVPEFHSGPRKRAKLQPACGDSCPHKKDPRISPGVPFSACLMVSGPDVCPSPHAWAVARTYARAAARAGSIPACPRIRSTGFSRSRAPLCAGRRT
ncbi:putative damage-inducible protein DinB [Salipiger aestuarii]|uniref:Putative damage-inducible protein DinB n=1 Tax=Salipiger aestuarii TaxID=568098 RepID=A0A327Y9L9_9RHOB|nr:putative damage-inducible protein DinB [Salipiger aestuarii]